MSCKKKKKKKKCKLSEIMQQINYKHFLDKFD